MKLDDLIDNLIAMKRLLRQGWIRAGVPVGSIESIADHSWSTAVLTLIYGTLENKLYRGNKPRLNVEKAVCIALLHDLSESEYFDIDKSIHNILTHDKAHMFQEELKQGAIEQILRKVPDSATESIKDLLDGDPTGDEWHLVKVADLMDLLLTATRHYGENRLIGSSKLQEFQQHTLQRLEPYREYFGFLPEFLESLTF